MNIEFDLMCLTARVDFSPEAAQFAINLVQSGSVDWPAFLARVERHYIAPLVHKNLRSISRAGVPAKVLDTLRVRSKLTAFRSEQFAAELARLAKLFDSQGIRTIHYKGVVTAQEFYGSVTLRNFNDLDFLIHPHDLRAVVKLLEQQGYTNSQSMTEEQVIHYVRGFKEFLFQRGEICLEPHWSLAGRRYPFDPDYEGFWKRSRDLQVRGTPVKVMSVEDSLLVLCLVGAKGRWKRLQMVTDVAACINRLRDEDWPRVFRRAAATRTVRILHLGLTLAHQLSGAALPAEAQQQLDAERLAERVIRQLTNGIRPPRWLPNTPSIFSSLMFQQRESLRDRLTYLWQTSTTADLLHLQRMPLPRAAHPLYRVLVPVHDLVVYPASRLLKAILTPTT